MRTLITYLTFLVAFSSSLHAQICTEVSGENVVKSLKLSAFTCKQKTAGTCQYSECIGKVAGYSQNVLITVPTEARTLRVHFHGHRQGMYPSYEKDLPSMVKAFGLANSLCRNQEVTVFPESKNRCDEFDKELVGRASFDAFFKGITVASGGNLKDLPLHVSAHSGGGRTIARMLDSGINPDHVTVFDGIYSKEQRAAYKKWLEKGTGTLTLNTVAWGEPSQHAQTLLKEWGLRLKPQTKKFSGHNYKVQSAPRLELRERQLASDPAHMDVVSETWPLSNF